MINQTSFNDYFTRAKTTLPKDCLANKLAECKKIGDIDGMNKLLGSVESNLQKTRETDSRFFTSSGVSSSVVGHLVSVMSTSTSYCPPYLSRSSSGGSVSSYGSDINITVHPFSII